MIKRVNDVIRQEAKNGHFQFNIVATRGRFADATRPQIKAYEPDIPYTKYEVSMPISNIVIAIFMDATFFMAAILESNMAAM